MYNTQHVNLSCTQPASPNNPTVTAHHAALHLNKTEQNPRAHDAVLSPDAASPLGRQILRFCRKCRGRERRKKEPSGREEPLKSAKRKGYPQTMLEF